MPANFLRRKGSLIAFRAHKLTKDASRFGLLNGLKPAPSRIAIGFSCTRIVLTICTTNPKAIVEVCPNVAGEKEYQSANKKEADGYEHIAHERYDQPYARQS